jgi:hypothetical protein
MSTELKKSPESIHRVSDGSELLAHADELTVLAAKLLGIANDLRDQARKMRVARALGVDQTIRFPGHRMN